MSLNIISWNINGANARQGTLQNMLNEDYDIIFLSETKISPKNYKKLKPKLNSSGYSSHWSFCEKPGKHGTAMYVKTSLNPTCIIDFMPDKDGRVICFGLPEQNIAIIGTYVPNVGGYPKLPNLPYRMEWDEKLRQSMGELKKQISK